MTKLELYDFSLQIIDGTIPSRELCVSLLTDIPEAYYILALVECLPPRHIYGADTAEQIENLANIIRGLAQQIDISISDDDLKLYSFYMVSCKCNGGGFDETVFELCEQIIAFKPDDEIRFFVWYQILNYMLRIYISVRADVKKLRDTLKIAKEYEAQYDDTSTKIFRVLRNSILK